MAAQAHIGHVDAQLVQHRRYRRHGAVFVLVSDDQGVEHAVKADVDAVHLVHQDAAAAYAARLKLQLFAAGVPGFDHGGVGVSVPQFHGVDGELQPTLFSLLVGVGYAEIVGLHAQKTGHQGPVRAVTGAGLGKGAVQMDLGLHRLVAQQRPGHAADADRSRRVGAGRAHHHRAQNIKNIQHVIVPRFLCATRAMIAQSTKKSDRVSEIF